jgi:hypothetical protein
MNNLLDPEQPEWKRLQIAHRAGDAKRYALVPAGEELKPTADHVKLEGSGTPLWLQEASMTDLDIADLVYAVDGIFSNRFNLFLEQRQSKFGPFTHISDAGDKLLKLRRSKPNKAVEFQGLLDDFAEQESFSSRAFEQWKPVEEARYRRDMQAHQIKFGRRDLSHLKGLLRDNDISIASHKDAVQALVIAAESWLRKS